MQELSEKPGQITQPKTFKRNELGLLDGVNYVYHEDGSINWRSMIKEEYLFPNKDFFVSRGQPVPTSIEGLEDNKLLISLSGIKDLLKLRGYHSVKYEVVTSTLDHVCMKCSIVFIKNFETEREVLFEDVANATISNTSGFGSKFLSPIASNRAFVRTVRNFLNIFIVGSDEIDSSRNKTTPQEEEQEVALPSPQSALKKALKEIGVDSRESFVAYLDQLTQSNICNFPDYKNWKSSNDVPVKESRIIIALTKENKFAKT